MSPTFMPQKSDLKVPLLGDSGSTEALNLLGNYTKVTKLNKIMSHLQSAMQAFREGQWNAGAKAALEALKIDEKSGEAWHFLAIAREKSGDMAQALTCFETALTFLPDNTGIANDIGRLAFRLEHYELAIKFFYHVLAREPNNLEAINNLCSALRELERPDEAITVLQDALARHPENATLWNNIGTIMSVMGEQANARLFFEEALKYDNNNAHALHNLGVIKAAEGEFEAAISDLKRAIPLFEDKTNVASAKLTIGFSYLAQGDLTNGWAWYEARHREQTIEHIRYLFNAPRWKAPSPLPAGKVLISAEQGLGDEVMFATVLPDIIAANPQSEITLAVEPRLVSLFARSFSNQKVVRHHTTLHNGLTLRLFPEVGEGNDYAAYGLLADFFGPYRGAISDFAHNKPYLKPDEVRQAHWRATLGAMGPKPKVGILWKSLIGQLKRSRFFSPFEAWKPVLSFDGVQFINLQYGDVASEMAQAKAAGFDIATMPDIDLKQDLDDLSALTSALDLIIGPANATSNIAAASGAKVWAIVEPHAWTQLGTDHLPWYPDVRVFTPPQKTVQDGGWDACMIDIVGALKSKI